MLIVSRNEVIPVLNNIVVAPVTSTTRAIPTCIPVGVDHGIDHDSAATFDNMAAVPKSVLTRKLGQLGVTGDYGSGGGRLSPVPGGTRLRPWAST